MCLVATLAIERFLMNQFSDLCVSVVSSKIYWLTKPERDRALYDQLLLV